ncbi:MAG: hypothetical protein WBC70_15015 [Candidatus Aminicenantales bacterium]
MKAVSSIRWTEHSVEHIAKHAISPREVEEACFNELESPYIRSGIDDLHYVFGRTDAGRFLFIVVKYERRGQVRVITARDMNDWEKEYYIKRGK